jgi:spore germination protein KC
MKKIRSLLLSFIILINSIFSSGCWNYREVDEYSIIAGLAVDKGTKNEFQMTAEIIKISAGRESRTTSEIITTEGKTMFDAARNMITLTGKKLYWAHAKVVILSKQVASEGVTKALEWYNRDAETRENVYILISKKPTAKEIFSEHLITEQIKSFEMEEMIKNQVSLSKAPIVEIMKYNIESRTKGISTVIPAVDLIESAGKITAQVAGTAIIKHDKLVGFLNDEETKDLIFIRNEIKGGILNEDIRVKDNHTRISLEIFKSKTKVTPIVDGSDIKINLNINTTVAIDEIDGKGSFFDEEGLKKLEETASSTQKKRIEVLINKIKSNYDADILLFALKLQENKPKTWKSVAGNWDEVFANMKVDVNTRVHIRNSAILSNSIEEGV